MSSLLIIGGSKEERKSKALSVTNSQFQISNFDALFVEAETSIGISQIREIEHNLALKPYNSPYKAAIIHPGELLTLEAQNALLKTLEESNESSIIILTAPQTETLLPTVVSRCQIIKLPIKSEIIIDKEEFQSISNLLFTILNSRVGERLKIAAGLGKNRGEIKSWLEKQLFFWRKVLLDKSNLSNLTNETNSPIANLTATQVVEIIRNLEKTRSLVDQNVNPRLALEVFLLDLPCIF